LLAGTTSLVVAVIAFGPVEAFEAQPPRTIFSGSFGSFILELPGYGCGF